MGKKRVSHAIALLLVITMLIISLPVGYMNRVAAEGSNNTTASSAYTSEILNQRYTYVSQTYETSPYHGEVIEIPIGQAYNKDGELQIATDSFGYKNDAVQMNIGQKGEFVVEAPEAAVYYISFDYLSYDEAILPVEMSMKVNGVYPFYEARRLVFESLWKDNEEKSYDRYGNQIVAVPEKMKEWNNKYVMDASYRYSLPLGVQLKKGTNVLELAVSEGNILIGNIYLNPEQNIPEYSGSEKAAGEQCYEIQAEEPLYRNDSSIHGICEYDVNLTPYEIDSRVLNTIDGTSFKDAGQTITYEQEVEQSGYFNIALNYRQSDKADFPVFINVKIDGKIPNTEYKDYPLNYDKSYKMTTLQDNDNNKLSVYLEKGVHTISFTISIDPIRYVLESVEGIMSEVNNLSLEIVKVAGTNKDKYRDLDMEAYIPGVGQQLIDYADILDSLMEDARVYSPGKSKIGAFSQISVASSQLRSLGKEPDKLPYRMAELATSVNSVNTFLANLLDGLNKNKLSVDRIYLYQEGAKLPKKIGFFRAAGMSIKRFVSSFFKQDYSASNTNQEHLQIWVNRSRQHLEIMQKMIDEQFTAETGIKVDLSLMPDQNKLVLANASGDAPDIATGINYAIPFELGIRGAVEDLTKFEDFSEVAGRYSSGLLVPATIEDGIYALPETRNFWVLYYRKDILEKLDLEVPDTMEDVKNMLPELQMRGLNFYYPTAGMLAMRTFHGTTPLLFQHGASLYGDYAGDTTINSEEAVAGFEELTELFTIYNLPKDIPSFYQHFRNGDLPVGIADYSVYNLLTNAAPEIANSWGIAVVPGVVDENGEVLRYTSGGMESTVMFKSDDEREEKAWQFMKWWSSAEVQAEYGQTLQITYGDEYIWSTANTEAFQSLPIKSEDKKVIVSQDEWIMEAPRIFGSYLVEREISNAYNAIVVQGKDLRITLDNSVKRINRETERKLEEFGYLKDGEVLKQYKIPNNETVEEILKNNE
ncbi:extracellular solute-binding protein [Anaeromicropila populeti]|uniref:ABC-type glycerol-3-phosphate transport system, substrate-binding protein n=1 Tax=Anaeromicropila populeti TaxID=37658 RepID=A0A1I6LPC2_9FIRM|nr:extracellular solute-binding protein [Anaeromicropila populeti]SFS05249.1 ABC-type glycerol-3-phosphate transport system, substrate-binding protein [Anaeromicropila populeti]